MRLVIFLWCFIALVSAAPQYHVLPSLRDRAAIQNSWQKERIEKVIPRILEKYNVDMWIIAQREYGEDTVFWSLKMAETFAARRRTIYIFERTNGTYRHHIFLDNTAQIWKDVRSVVEKADPRSIVLNIDQDIAFSDGLHAGEREILERTLGPWRARIRREPNVAVEVIETRVDGMLEVYRQMMENVHAMISEAFSARTITPGQTTTMDLVWWYRERIQAQNMTTWFHPSVEVFRKGGHDKVPNEPEDEDVVILPGDVLHVDVGVVAYGLATDTQHMGYVLAEGETEPPATIKNALRTHSNKMQDAVRRALKVGSTGDDVLKESLEDIERQGVVGTVYSHPIGDWGHSAGPLIGMTNLQKTVPVKGQLKLVPNSWFSVELQASVPIPEWDNQTVPFRQEEDVYIDEHGENHWVYGRQEELHIVDWANVTEPRLRLQHQDQ